MYKNNTKVKHLSNGLKHNALNQDSIVTNQLLFLESHAKVIPNKIAYINPLNAKFTKRPNTLKQFVGSRRIV